MLMDQFDLSQNIIVRLGLENAPEKAQQKILKTAVELVTQRVMLRLMEILPASDVSEANKLAGKPEELIVFLTDKVDDLASLIDVEVETVKNELVLNASLPENI